MTADAATLESLNRGFRQRYLDYRALTDQLRAWADAFPELVRLDSLATTPDGRELWLLTVGPKPDQMRPAVWVDGNLHAVELAGSSVALAIAEDAIRLHLAPDDTAREPSAAVRAAARDVIFHVMPRISPDGAETVLKHGGYVRSVPRDARLHRQQSHWRAQDVDGDGVALAMRIRDPAGEYVESADFPGLMLERSLADEGPFYKVYPEGVIEHFNGHTIPAPTLLDDNTPDLNRNFPFDWAPEAEQEGAGPFPGSEPESRAILEFAVEHPNLFAWFNLHTFGGVYIRPRQDVPDTEMNHSDLAVFRQLEAWAQALAGYPMISGFEEFTYDPGKPLHGNLSDFAYHQRGCIAVVCELWDLFAELGIERRKPFVDHYTHTTPEELLHLARWDREHNSGRVVRPWRKVRHPQLGDVETGGWDPRVGVSNPPYERLPEVCAAQGTFWIKVAALAPKVEIAHVHVDRLADGVSHVQVEIRNRGYLPTYVLASARDQIWNEPLYAEIQTDVCTLANPAEAHQPLGHLEGWGRGLHSGGSSLFHRYSGGSGNRVQFSTTVSGSGRLTIRVGSCRVGWIEQDVTV